MNSGAVNSTPFPDARTGSNGPRRLALVTGAAGFIGSALSSALLARGYTVTMLDLRPVPVHHPRARSLTVDICDRTQLTKLAGGYDVVFHLAANTENRPGLSGRWDDYEVTVGGTVALLEALLTDAPPVMILASTQLVYGGDAGNADETAPLRPPTSFAAAKAAAEAFLCAYAERAGVGAIVCRLANVVGPGVTRGVVADLAAQLRSNPRRLRVLGDGRQRRAFVHLDDCVSAFLTVAGATGKGLDVFNVSNSDSITVADIARIVVESHPESDAQIEFAGGSAWAGDATALHPNPGRLLHLGWHPSHTSREAVRSAARAMFFRAETSPISHTQEPWRHPS
jgi:UDP-glucose 4-epimerase